MQGRRQGPTNGPGSYQKAVDACASRRIRFEEIGFSALPGAVSHGAVEPGDEEYGDS